MRYLSGFFIHHELFSQQMGQGVKILERECQKIYFNMQILQAFYVNKKINELGLDSFI